jgi:CheY-like chemotaxis protein
MTACGVPKQLTILVVEDDQIARPALMSLLEGAGHRVIAVGDGRQALDEIRAGIIPELILLDMLLPILDGWHFLDVLRAHPEWKSIPIMIMTGIVLSPEWAHDHGCTGFLKKPIDNHALFQEVNRCLSLSNSAATVHDS